MTTRARIPLVAGLAVFLAAFSAAGPPRAPRPDRQAAGSASAAYRVATFDSGFGGYFTAKEIEKQAAALAADGYGPFLIAHYGDTTNIPYGEKTPEQIASFASAGILAAFRDGARDVYVACNTASTQIAPIRDLLRRENPAYANRVHSIIDVSVAEVMKTVGAALRQRDLVTVAILATPATVKSEAYPRMLAKALNVPFTAGTLTKATQPRWLASKGPTIDSFAYVTTFALGPRKKVEVYQFAPANWVEMIENGAPDTEKRAAVHTDLTTLTAHVPAGAPFAVVGEFCTHYPVFDAAIREELRALGRTSAATPFVVQGPLMGQVFRQRFLRQKPPKAARPAPAPGTPPIYLSGTNIDATRALVRKIFPNDPEPVIERKAFGPE